MYILSTVLTRPATEVDRVWRTVQERDVMTGVNFLSGVKFGKFFPESPSKAPLRDTLSRNPALRALHNEYRKIALYPQFNDPERSAHAASAIYNINRHKRLIERSTGVPISFEEAAENYAQHDDEGAGLALMVRGNRWKPEGKKEKDAFKDRYPAYAIAVEELTPPEARLLSDSLRSVTPLE